MKKKILIVDDNSDLICILQVLLKNKGYDTVQAMNGKQAVDMATAQLPDLIVMDIMMPVMDGLEALTRLKENPATATIPVILLTAQVQHMDVLAGYKTGAVYYITKPFKRQELLNGINLFLGNGEGIDPQASQ